MYDGDIEHIDNAYLWQSDGEYHYEEESEKYTRDYHQNTHQEKDHTEFLENFTFTPPKKRWQIKVG
jgi:hypothetical protein